MGEGPGRVLRAQSATGVELKMGALAPVGKLDSEVYAHAMQSKFDTVREYLAALPADRRSTLQAVRKVILKNLDKNYEEGMQCGMIGYYVPHRVYPAGYHCDPSQPLPFAALASQKNHQAVYLNCVYASAPLRQRFCERWAKSGKKLDMGKACIRFRNVEDGTRCNRTDNSGNTGRQVR